MMPTGVAADDFMNFLPDVDTPSASAMPEFGDFR